MAGELGNRGKGSNWETLARRACETNTVPHERDDAR
eukprot:CAMPEP_0185171842 /NCGR_PEP_ID=MMETSP1139-20130426/20694_1 /TAXON_ID=298111 /ORGANISM="Pavlova sp., Strain CCMP459" /LENGTH=35 /DNA_ID= /DNA_START= /DNA_END= /DNA_ORIENTATION=